MACRTPVIATRAGAAPELIAQGGGVLVDDWSSDTMAASIMQSLSIPEEKWLLMSQKARATTSGYTWDDATLLLEKAALSLIKRRQDPMLEVSVIIPMYNAEHFVQKALISVLQENSIPLEVIVVNDKSTDMSLAKVHAIKDQRIRIVTGEGKGIAACFNTGLANVQGNIVMRCDADDMYPPGRIKYQAEWLNSHLDFGAICGGFSAIDRKGKHLRNVSEKRYAGEITGELNEGITSTHYCTFATRTNFLHKLKGMREYFVTAEDIDLQLRLGELGRVWFEPDTYYLYRLHNASITHCQPDNERVFFEKTARAFQQQRQKQGYDALQAGSPPLPPEGSKTKANRASSHIQGMLLGEAWQQHAAGNKREAIKIGLRSLIHKPTSIKTWRSLAALLLKK